MLRIVYASFRFAFCVNFSSQDVWERPHMWTLSETPQRAAHLFGDRTNYGLADFVATTWDPREIEKKSIRKDIWIFNELHLWKVPENQSVASAALSSATEMLHTHTDERAQSHLIRLDMCPTVELCNAGAVRVSADCSSNEMRIANSRRHAPVNDDADWLKKKKAIYL